VFLGRHVVVGLLGGWDLSTGIREGFGVSIEAIKMKFSWLVDSNGQGYSDKTCRGVKAKMRAGFLP